MEKGPFNPLEEMQGTMEGFPVADKDTMDIPSKSSMETSTNGDVLEEPSAKQTIIEVPNGQSLNGQPQQPGPQYKRGRGRSFFKEAPRKGVACQGEPFLFYLASRHVPMPNLRDYYKVSRMSIRSLVFAPPIPLL